MAVRFAIFSTERGASLDPFSLQPAPATLIDLKLYPLHGSFDPEAGETGRGCRIQTLDGVMDQDFGVVEEDQRIQIRTPVIQDSEALVSQLKAAHAVADAQYYITSGLTCWKVKFERPGGLKAVQDLWWKEAQNITAHTIEIKLKVVA